MTVGSQQNLKEKKMNRFFNGVILGIFYILNELKKYFRLSSISLKFPQPRKRLFAFTYKMGLEDLRLSKNITNI